MLNYQKLIRKLYRSSEKSSLFEKVNFSMSSYIQQAINAIIRPPRCEYNLSHLPLFLKDDEGNSYVRHPLNFSNQRNQKIVGSLYIRGDKDIMSGGPCMIYLHGNSSSQVEGQFLIPNVCKYGVALYVFDFAGCGKSDGEYITLGVNETNDLNYLIDQLNFSFNLGPFGLWGRSMGAATAILSHSKKVVVKIVDSTFTSVQEEVKAMAAKIGVPGLMIPTLTWMLGLLVDGKSGINVYSASPLEEAKKEGQPPMLMCHAVDDDLVPYAQGRAVFEAYSNQEKEFVDAANGHNSRRSTKWLEKACNFIFEKFGIEVEDFHMVSTSHLNESHHFNDINQLLESNKVVE